MKQFVLGFLLMILSAAAFAQQHNAADSIYQFTQSLRKLNYTQQNAAALITSDYYKVSTVSLDYTIKDGHFRPVQTAESSREVSFRSSGVSTIGRFKMSGYFNFVRTWQDSLAWTLQGVPDQKTPYYFAAAKAGKYERLNYNFGGLLTYGLIKDKLYLAAGVDYFYNTASRSVDPRPSVQTFELTLNPQILYKTGKQVIGAELNLAYGKEENSIAYKSKQYGSQSPFYPDRISYLVMGYGSTREGVVSRLKRYTNANGFGLNYAYQGDKVYLMTKLNYKHEFEDNLNSVDDSKNNSRYGSFTLNSYNGSLLTGIKTGNYQHQLQVNIQSETGFDNNYAPLNGLSNYKYSHQNLAIYYTALKQSSRQPKTELGLNLIYDNVHKKDLSNSISARFGYIQPGINGTLYNYFKDQSRLSVSLTPGIRLPVGNEVKVPVTDNIFANNIIYPDYTYWSSTAGILDLRARYITPRFFKNINSGIGLNASYISSLSAGTNYQTSTFTPSKNRVDLTLSFNFYF